MKKTTSIVLIFMVSFFPKLFAQSADTLSPIDQFLKKNKFFRYFLLQDSTSQSYLFNVGVKYQYTAVTKSFASNGLCFHLGFNPSRFFSRKMVLGVFYELRPIHGPFFHQPTSKHFRNDFSSNFNTRYSSPEDSAVAYTLKRAIENKSLSAGSFGSFGCMFSPFPNKYGGFLFSFKVNGCGYRIGGVYGDKLISNGELDNIYFGVGLNYIYELSFKPFAFKHNTYFYFDKESPDSKFLKSLTFSIYYQRLNLKDAELAGSRFRDMVSGSFLSAYGSTNSFGLSIGWTMY